MTKEIIKINKHPLLKAYSLQLNKMNGTQIEEKNAVWF